MKKTIRFASILMIFVLLAGEFLPAYARSSPGGDVEIPDNPFDVRIVTNPTVPKKDNGASSAANKPVGPGYAGSDGNPVSISAGTSKYEDFVLKTWKKANGIIEVSTRKPLDGLKYKLIVTPYAQYPTIADVPSRQLCPVAYTDVTTVPVLSDYLPIINHKAVEAGVAPNTCYTYQVFDVTYYRDYGTHLEKSDNFDTISLSLPDYVLDRFICLLHYMNGAWYVVENANVIKEKNWLRFSVDELSPFAIIIHDDQNAAAAPSNDGAVRSPQTGYDLGTEIYLTVKEWLIDLFD